MDGESNFTLTSPDVKGQVRRIQVFNSEECGCFILIFLILDPLENLVTIKSLFAWEETNKI